MADHNGEASTTVSRPVQTVSGLLHRDCAGTVAIHAASLSTRCEDTHDEATKRAALATRAVRMAISLASQQDPGMWQDPIATLEGLLYPHPNATTREAISSLANKWTGPLAPTASLSGVDDVFVHSSERSLPIDGGYGRSFPLAGGRMLIEQQPNGGSDDDDDGSNRPEGAATPCVNLTFPTSDPNFPYRCARICICTVPDSEGLPLLLRVTTHAETDRRQAEAPGLTIGPREGSLALRKELVASLFAPSVSQLVTQRCSRATWWIGLHDIDMGMQRRVEDETVISYVVPTFLTRAFAHIATRNLRLHVVVNAAAVGQGGKVSATPLWRRCVAFEPATFHSRGDRSNEDHTFYLRARMHKTYCQCLCRAYAPLVAGGHLDEVECEPCLDVYMCGRSISAGRCPVHAGLTVVGSNNVCVARTSVRLKCVHSMSGAPPSVPRWGSTYNSLDHELVLSLTEKVIFQEIVSSAHHLRKCAILDEERSDSTPLGEVASSSTDPVVGTEESDRPLPSYLLLERDRLELRLPDLYDLNDREERKERKDPGDSEIHSIETLERDAEDTTHLTHLDDRATDLLCAGDISVEIGEDRIVTPDSFPDRGKLRIVPHLAKFRGVTKLWRQSSSCLDGKRVRVGVKYAKILEFNYGRLFPHRRAPPRHRTTTVPRRCALRTSDTSSPLHREER